MSKKKRSEEHDFRITPYHVNNSVTGSSVLCEVDGLKILLDLGMFQSQTHKLEDIYKINHKKLQIPFDKLDYIILSSGHADHCCGLGVIGRRDVEFNGRVMATELSAELIGLNVRDSAHLMRGECEAYNKSHNANLIPLYNESDAENALTCIQGYGHNEKIKLNDNVYFEFLPNGHLSGDGSIYITYQKDEYTKKRLLYTGDHNFGREKPFTKKWVEKCLKADCIISESTYSGKGHLKQDNFKVLEDAILDVCINKKEILFIPTFAIHRQTEVEYMLKKIFDKNKILRNSNIPIYSAGVMSAKAHRILGNPKYKCFYDEKWQELDDVFEWDRVEHIERFKDVSEKLIDNKVKIICASSGMLTGGYGSYLASCFVNRKNVHFLFSGYQAIGSVGDKIMSQEHKTVSIQGKAYVIKANSLGKLDLSGHAGNDELIGLIKSVNQKVLKKVILIHGDDDRKELLKDQLEKVLNEKEIIIPKMGEVIKF
jgi:metallo-beta-lactamase family protein